MGAVRSVLCVMVFIMHVACMPADVEYVKEPGAHLAHPKPQSLGTDPLLQSQSKYGLLLTQKDTGCANGCSGHGDCIKNQCQCDQGYDGVFCERAVCLRNCGGNGYCNDGVCVCHKGWKGADCLTDTCPSQCSFHGKCVAGECICNPGWKGFACATAGLGLTSLVPLEKVGQPQIFWLDNSAIAVRLPRQTEVGGRSFTNATIAVTINQTCADTSHSVASSRSIPVNFAGDSLIEKAVKGCTIVDLIANYGGKQIQTTVIPREVSPAELVIVSSTPKNMNAPCMNGCSGHGECVDGICQCQLGWIGACCCRRDRTDDSPRAIDPLQTQPGYPAFKGPPSTDDKYSETHLASDMMEDDRYLQPSYQGTDVLTMLQLEADACCV